MTAICISPQSIRARRNNQPIIGESVGNHPPWHADRATGGVLEGLTLGVCVCVHVRFRQSPPDCTLLTSLTRPNNWLNFSAALAITACPRLQFALAHFLGLFAKSPVLLWTACHPGGSIIALQLIRERRMPFIQKRNCAPLEKKAGVRPSSSALLPLGVRFKASRSAMSVMNRHDNGSVCRFSKGPQSLP